VGRTRKDLVYRRRLAVRKLYLKGFEPQDILNNKEFISRFPKTTLPMIKNDIKEIGKWYLAAVEKNPNILEKQAEYILKHLDELKLIKQRFHEIADRAKNEGKLKEEIMACRAIVDELSHEARVLKLIDVTKTINQYIHIDKIGILVNGVIEVIKEFVPMDKQKYALTRLKDLSNRIIDINTEGGSNE